MKNWAIPDGMAQLLRMSHENDLRKGLEAPFISIDITRLWLN